MHQVTMFTKTRVVPDAIEWLLYDEREILRGSGQSINVAAEPTARGNKLTLAIALPELPPGTYTIECTTQVGEKTFTHTESYIIESNSFYDDEVIIAFEPKLKWLAPFDGSVRITSGETDLAKGVITFGSQIDLGFGQLKPSMVPYFITLLSNEGEYESRRLYYINPSIGSAMGEIRKFIDRLNMDCRLDSLKLSDGDYLDMLQRGMDHFNGIGLRTDFYMSNAQGPIRHYWLLCAQWWAITTRYLEEGLTSFNYSGAAIQLDIDVTQYLDAYAGKLEAQLGELPAFKRQLALDSNTGGSGAYGLGKRTPGATGVSWGPVTGSSFFR